jgi:activating signal cointegrator 1
MNALTLHEPWASLIAYGWKEVETRDWYTSYRGPLAIHAAHRKPDPTEQSRITFALGHRGFELPPLSPGCIVCVCQLAACVPTTRLAIAAKALRPEFKPRHDWAVELQFGNYDMGRWAWILRDVHRFQVPFHAKGARKLWIWDAPASVWDIFQRPAPAGVSTSPALASPRSGVGDV